MINRSGDFSRVSLLGGNEHLYGWENSMIVEFSRNNKLRDFLVDIKRIKESQY